MSQQKIEFTQNMNGSYFVVVTGYPEIGPETWGELLLEIDPLQVNEIKVDAVQVVKTKTFSVFTKLERLIYQTSPMMIHGETVEGCYQLKKIKLPFDKKQMKMNYGAFYGFNKFFMPKEHRSNMIFLWEEKDQWTEYPIDPEEVEKSQARDRLVIDNGWVTDFKLVCVYWMGYNSGYYTQMNAFTRLFSMYVPGFPEEDAVIARIVKKPAGATIYMEDPEHWMQCGTIHNFFSHQPAIVIPRAEKVGEGISLTVDFKGREYPITGWGKSSHQTLTEFFLPQLRNPCHRSNPKISKIEVMMFDYPWDKDDDDYETRESEWVDKKDITIQQFLYYIMSKEVDPKRLIYVHE